MALSDFNKQKKLDVTSVTGTPTISHAVPIKITSGDDSSTGTGEIVLDWTNISSESDIAVYDENDNLLDYWIESFDSTNETAVIHVYRDWVQDGSTQAKVAYGSGPSDQSVSSSTVFDKEDTNSGLVSGWALNESSGDALDLTSNNNTGTPYGNVTQGVDGQINKAYKFDGSDDVASTSYATEDGNDYSYAYWMKTTSGDMTAMGAYETDGTSNGLMAGVGDLIGFVGATPGSVSIFTRYDNGNANAIYTDNTYNDGNWHHVVATFDYNKDASGLNLYVDGEDVSTSVESSQGSGGNWVSRNVDIGYGGDRGYYFNGSIDDVRIYDRALSSDEVSAKYDASKSTPGFFSQQTAESIPSTLNLSNSLVFAETTDSTLALNLSEGASITDKIKSSKLIDNLQDSLKLNPGHRLKFNGSDENIEAPSDVLQPQGNLAVSQWVKLETLPSTDKKYEPTSIGGSVDYSDFYRTEIRDDGTVAAVLRDDSVSNNYSFSVESNEKLETGKWYNLIVNKWYDGSDSNMELYINGELDNSATDPHDMVGQENTSNTFKIAGGKYGGYYLDGYMDDVRVYHQALTTANIKDIYKEIYGELGSEYAHWKMNEGSGDTAYDSAGTNDGDINGATWIPWEPNALDSTISHEFQEDMSLSEALKTAIGINLKDKVLQDKNYLEFNGTSTLLQTDYIPELSGIDKYSLSLWYKKSGHEVDREIILIHGDFADNNAWGISLRHDYSDMKILIKDGGSWASVFDTGQYIIPEDGEWHNLIITFDSGSGEIYLDGELKATGTGNSTLPTPDTQQTSFLAKEDGSNLFKGKVDDFRNYTKTLTSTEINTLSNNRYTEIGGELTHWKMNEGSGDTAYDSADGYDGTLSGETWKILEGPDSISSLLKSRQGETLSLSEATETKLLSNLSESMSFTETTQTLLKTMLSEDIEFTEDVAIAIAIKLQEQFGFSESGALDYVIKVIAPTYLILRNKSKYLNIRNNNKYMTMNNYTFKEGDKGTSLKATLKDDDGATDLSGADNVKLYMRDRDDELQLDGGGMTVTNASEGEVEYQWNDGDPIDTPGVYKAEVIVSDASGESTFPNNGYVTITIEEDVQ